ncbi:RNase P modulator RnpM [Desulfonispora thiosulfatigenes]|uniref:RNase P modulator RnpM n=1 Tax=Desulfonispora thiosulfatigenes TaxID=83661 RepID=UPI003BFA6811
MLQKKIPQRMCIGCQTMFEKKQLLRIVKTPEGDIIIDPTGKKSGRGAYICSKKECLNTSLKSKRLEKAFKSKIPEDLYNTLEEYFNER